MVKVKNGLVDSVVYINETLKNIKDWDELMDLKKESKEENEETEEKSIEEPCIDNIFIFISFGVVFCIINLIGVQTSIIILNSLFNELVEEFKLWLNGTPRKYNFYQRIEINTYRNLGDEIKEILRAKYKKYHEDIDENYNSFNKFILHKKEELLKYKKNKNNNNLLTNGLNKELTLKKKNKIKNFMI